MTSALGHTLSHWHVVIAWIIFLASYLVFAIGRLPGTKIDRPAMAIIGAVLMFVFGVLSPKAAIESIDFTTLVLLFSMMLIVASLHLAGFFEWITRLAIEHLSPRQLLPGIIFISGILSAFLVNDIVCLMLAPLILGLCRRMRCVHFLTCSLWRQLPISAVRRPSQAIRRTFSSAPSPAFRIARSWRILVRSRFWDSSLTGHCFTGSTCEAAMGQKTSRHPSPKETTVTREPEMHPAFPMIVSLGCS